MIAWKVFESDRCCFLACNFTDLPTFLWIWISSVRDLNYLKDRAENIFQRINQGIITNWTNWKVQRNEFCTLKRWMFFQWHVFNECWCMALSKVTKWISLCWMREYPEPEQQCRILEVKVDALITLWAVGEKTKRVFYGTSKL